MRTLNQHKVAGNSEPLTINVMDAPSHGGACHEYSIEFFRSDGDHAYADPDRVRISFQNGPIKEHGVNGINGEALMAILIDRLEFFQSGPYSSTDNQEALDHIKAALEAQQRRTRARVARGVEGTSEK